PEARRALYLHSDMYSEYHHRFPNLSAIFAVMGRYDALVSVSPASMARNCEEIAARYGVSPARFTSCANLIQPQEICHQASMPLEADLDAFMTPQTFLSLGRLSPEKGHAKLFRAFARV